MKYYIKMQMALNDIKARLQDKKGQGTVEYLLMLGVIIVVAVAAGALFKSFMPDLFDKIKTKIFGGVQSM
ncbi:MAG: class III signal peptide-containing protein [Elusimicrobia bacterium]|nr:class III signal peptide-containing protein [Elusimicrobiota bacterium]